MKLRYIYNKYIPFKGYIALTFYPWVFIRKELYNKYTKKVDRHETTHALQQKETIWVGFLLLYCIEYIIKFVCTFNHSRAYKSISFEQEAYNNENNVEYNIFRKPYAWIKYILKLKEEKSWL